jgi:uncharacterized protein GlcG (DUF336 family)
LGDLGFPITLIFLAHRMSAHCQERVRVLAVTTHILRKWLHCLAPFRMDSECVTSRHVAFAAAFTAMSVAHPALASSDFAGRVLRQYESYRELHRPTLEIVVPCDGNVWQTVPIATAMMV